MISSATKCHLEKWRCYCHDRRQFSFNNNRKNSNKHWVTCFSANLKHHEAVDYQMDVYDEFERSDSVNMSIAVHKVVMRYVSMVEFIFDMCMSASASRLMYNSLIGVIPCKFIL